MGKASEYLTFIERNADLVGIAKNALCTASLPTKYTNHGLYLVFKKSGGAAMSKAEVLNDVDTIKVVVQDKVFGTVVLFDGSAADAYMLNAFRDASLSSYAQAGVIYIPYTRRRMPIETPGIALAIGMADATAYQVQVKFGNPTTLNTVSCEIYTEVDRAAPRPMGAHVRVSKYTRSISGTGWEQNLEVPFGEANTAMLGFHINKGSGAIAEVSVKHDGDIIIDRLGDALNSQLLHNLGRTLQTGFFHVDFTSLRRALPLGGVAQMQIDTNWSTAPNSHYLLYEIIHGVSM